jgi:hypothetical protein
MEKELFEITSEEYYEPQFESEKIIEDYKKKEFINVLQTGKLLIRRGLGDRLFELSGFVSNFPFSSLAKNNLKDSKSEFDSVLTFWMHSSKAKKHIYRSSLYKRTYPTNFQIITSDVFQKVLNYFLGKNKVTNLTTTWTVYFNKQNVSWGLLDEAIKKTYPNNYKNINGSISLYFKPQEINKIHETPHNFFNPFK